MTDKFIALGIVAFAVFFLWVGAITGVRMVTDAACLRVGYREASVAWNLRRYCIKRVDQTDVVIPLDSARKVR